MEAKVYSSKGKASGDITLSPSVFGAAWNADLVHQVVTAIQANTRAGTANTKLRGEVRGGGKKPWKQKGTGRARHGSRRSPIWVGGGIAHGPRSDKDYTQKLNKNVRARALASVLSKKYEDGDIIFVDTFGIETPKSKDARDILTNLGSIKGKETVASKKQNAALIILSGRDENTEKSFQNFGNVLVANAKDINPVDLLTYKFVVVVEPQAVVKVLERRVALKKERSVTSK